MRRDFQVIDLDYETAIRSAELRAKCRIPMADSIIATVAQMHRCPVVSDDPSLQKDRKH
ncbi:PIN domain-containing protein [Candidatus Bathyarchaeota archaeon]|nr:PIN domain-containing protein [Candidatus Bathyarchaeota archaeon]